MRALGREPIARAAFFSGAFRPAAERKGFPAIAIRETISDVEESRGRRKGTFSPVAESTTSAVDNWESRRAATYGGSPVHFEQFVAASCPFFIASGGGTLGEKKSKATVERRAVVFRSRSMFFGRYAKDSSAFRAAICPAESRQLI